MALDSRGNYIPKIADFGLSKSIYESDLSNITNSFGGGTLDYSSPEQLYGHPLRPNTDLWSFGVITYEVLSGKKPFSSDDISGNPEAKRRAIYQKIVHALLPADVNDCPVPYGDVIRLCLIKDPKQRVKKGEDLIEFLKNPTPLLIPEESYDEDETLIFGKEKEIGQEINPIEIFRKGAAAILGKPVQISPTTEEEVNKRAEEAARQRKIEEEEANRKVAEEKARKEAEEQARLKAVEEENIRREDERIAAEEKARKEAEEQARLKAVEEENRRREAERLAADEKARKEVEEQARRNAAEEENRRREDERIAAEEKARKEAEEQARLKAVEEENRRREAERLAADEKARKEAEEQARRKAAEEENRRREAERLAAEEKARKEAEEQARLKAVEEENRRREAERLAAEEKARKEAEEQARLKAVEEENRCREAERLAAEEKARKEAEEQARLKAALEENRRREAGRIATEEKARKEAEERKRKEDDDDQVPFWLLHWKKITAVLITALAAAGIWLMQGKETTPQPGIEIRQTGSAYIISVNGNELTGSYDTVYQRSDTLFALRQDSMFVFDHSSGQMQYLRITDAALIQDKPKGSDDGKAQEAINKIKKLPRDKVTVQILDNFLSTHPGSPWEKEVLKWKKELVDKLKETMNEEGMYNQAVQSQSITFCDMYLSQYPAGKYNKQIADLKARLVKSEEEELWNRAKTDGSTDAYQRYLGKYPTGSHSQEAKSEIIRIEEKKKKEQVAPTLVGDSPNQPNNESDKPTAVSPEPEVPTEKEPPVPPVVAAIDKYMVKIGRGGSHTLGCGEKSRGCDVKDGTKMVNIGPIMMGKFEVTQEQYRAVTGTNPSHFKDNLRNPVENLTYNEIMDFIKKLNNIAGNPYNYRLPTEAEWEYAALAGSEMLYSGSNEPRPVAVVDETGTSVVGRKKANAWGLHDMSGNVAEFCSDDYGPYSGGKISSRFKVVKGGSYLESESDAKIKKRSKAEKDRPFTFIGFRLVRELK